MALRSYVSRRQFLGGAASGLALGFAAPYILTANVFGANEQVVTGHIGMGGQGMGNLNPHKARCAAVCDVDKKRLEKARLAVGAKCEAYGDFRRLLDRKDINAVVISTPDHWHALPTVRACEAGKDVYCEKPLTLTIAEGRKMTQAARKYQRIVQAGSQQRSDAKFRLACELVRNGRIGNLQRVTVGIPGVNFKGPAVPDSDSPEELDYDLWLGPAPRRPYNVNRVHYNFRFFWDYSGGQITNWGAHHLDIAQWAMGTDDSGPIEIEGEAKHHPEGWYEVPQSFKVTYKYASGVTVTCGMGLPGGATFEGTNGKIYVDRGKLSSEPADIIDVTKNPLKEGDTRLYVSGNHHGNWLDCIKTRKPPICEVEIGHRSATVCHLGNIAVRCKRKIKWDPAKEQVIGDEEANKMVDKAYREPWRL